MNCSEARKQVDPWMERHNDEASLDPIDQHLQECQSCRKYFDTAHQSVLLLANLPKELPPHEFSTAWRARIRQEAVLHAKPNMFRWMERNHFMQPLLGAFFLVIFGLSAYKIFYHSHSLQPILQNRNSLRWEQQAKGKVNPAVSTVTLHIVSVGPKSKEVQRIIRNFRNSHEGGFTLSLRKQEDDLLTLKRLQPDEAFTLRDQLQQVGAKVKTVAEK